MKPLRVAARYYPLQRFTVPEDELRIAREQKRIDEIKAAFRDEADVDTSFRLPAQGKLTGNFGLRRIITFANSPALELLDLLERLAPFASPSLILRDPAPRMAK